uniref:Uncharacterized protein n=1 Tax=Anguilla anguilla TaxID=7936 RepID=A0A0E9VRA9_ANGAN
MTGERLTSNVQQLLSKSPMDSRQAQLASPEPGLHVINGLWA